MIDLKRSVQTFHGAAFITDPAWRERLERVAISNNLPWDMLSAGERVSDSPHSSCFRIEMDDGEVVYFKRYIYPPKRQFEFMFRPSKAAVDARRSQQALSPGSKALRAAYAKENNPDRKDGLIQLCG